MQITAEAWSDASGLPRTDFEPAMRFAPGAANAVVLAPHDRAGNPSLATRVDPETGFRLRRIKHFSGHTVIVGLDGGADTPEDVGGNR